MVVKQSFVPAAFTPPKRAILGNYMLEPITTKDTIEDWIVLKNNVNAIAKQRGAGSRKDWPYRCTLEEDYKDLAWLELGALYKQLFCYIIRDKETHSYVGAVYVYPIELFYAQKAKKHDVDFSFWITQSEYDKGVYELIFQQLFNWLATDWPFTKERIYARNALIPQGIKAFLHS